MFLKKKVDENSFSTDGYIVLDTDLEHNYEFKLIVNDIYKHLNLKLKNTKLKKMGGYFMGNFGINQGPFGPKLYSMVFKDQFLKLFEILTGKQVKLFDIFYGGNLVMPKKGKQNFHIDGAFNKKMYLVSIATENISLTNGPTEICVGSHNEELKYWKFFFSKKKKKKLLLKKGQILIRKHNLWHRGTKNLSNTPRLLLSFILTPKVYNNKIDPMSSNLEILPNFFKKNLLGKFQEFSYVYLSGLHVLFKILISLIRQK